MDTIIQIASTFLHCEGVHNAAVVVLISSLLANAFPPNTRIGKVVHSLAANFRLVFGAKAPEKAVNDMTWLHRFCAWFYANVIHPIEVELPFIASDIAAVEKIVADLRMAPENLTEGHREICNIAARVTQNHFVGSACGYLLGMLDERAARDTSENVNLRLTDNGAEITPAPTPTEPAASVPAPPPDAPKPAPVVSLRDIGRTPPAPAPDAPTPAPASVGRSRASGG